MKFDPRSASASAVQAGMDASAQWLKVHVAQSAETWTNQHRSTGRLMERSLE
jgi:hypothetical protein